ncbi:hypothetical protein SAMN02910369_01684 [Lachnospiraceae bacterium NE2001]|nr:hypothetical protein SAMN02910369_01684 [Lachnospiraceae bacterium NE2001]
MSVIDRKMYTRLKNWCDCHEGDRPKNQNIMYVNSHDHALTKATIKKTMFEMKQEDIHGELYISLYSAENLFQNMRKYFSHISELYGNIPDDKESVIDIVNGLIPTCGWIVLIVEDIDKIAENDIQIQEFMRTIITFASKHSSIILVGNGNKTDVLSRCEYVSDEMFDDDRINGGENQHLIGLYNQEASPDRENLIYETYEKHSKELNYYWSIIYDQLENGFFDYEGFKILFKETMEYIVPRVTKLKIYRRDISLIENIGAMRDKRPKVIEGCKLWEFEAARQFANGLHYCIENKSGENDDISKEKIDINVVIEHRKEHHGILHISGATYTTIVVSVDDVCEEMDYLSNDIFSTAYDGGSVFEMLKRVRAKRNKNNIVENTVGKLDQVGESFNALMDGIKEAADKTINKDSGKKVRRYKDNQKGKNE